MRVPLNPRIEVADPEERVLLPHLHRRRQFLIQTEQVALTVGHVPDEAGSTALAGRAGGGEGVGGW